MLLLYYAFNYYTATTLGPEGGLRTTPLRMYVVVVGCMSCASAIDKQRHVRLILALSLGDMLRPAKPCKAVRALLLVLHLNHVRVVVRRLLSKPAHVFDVPLC